MNIGSRVGADDAKLELVTRTLFAHLTSPKSSDFLKELGIVRITCSEYNLLIEFDDNTECLIGTSP